MMVNDRDRETREWPKCRRGVVRWYNPNMGYGFITEDESGLEYYFKVDNQKFAWVTERGRMVGVDYVPDRTRDVKVDDRVCFRGSPNRRQHPGGLSPVVSTWFFEDEYDACQKIEKSLTVYRIFVGRNSLVEGVEQAPAKAWWLGRTMDHFLAYWKNWDGESIVASRPSKSGKTLYFRKFQRQNEEGVFVDCDDPVISGEIPTHERIVQRLQEALNPRMTG
ncbi:MAG: hypothetical protein ABIA47_00350 [bacterium]